MNRKHLILALSLIFLFLFSVARAQSYTFSTDLTPGSMGDDVTNLQTWLIANGFSIPAISNYGTAKGYYGTQTQNALAAYQRSVGLPAYGYLDAATRSRINGSSGGTSAGPLRIISPNGGESWRTGTTQMITWTSPYYFRATTADLRLVRYQPCNGVCNFMALAPYVIATGLSINQNSYSWNVGHVSPLNSPIAGQYSSPIAPDGQYSVQICETGTSNCDTSDAPFYLYSGNPTQTGQAPSINGVDAPTTLSVNQTGTWTVRATDYLNGTLSYAVDWGDQAYPVSAVAGMPVTSVASQSAVFTHAYTSAGTYTVTFTVRNASGLSSQSRVTVTVTGYGQSSVSITSPQGGEIWPVNSVHMLAWNLNGANIPNSRIDLYLGQKLYVPCYYGANCPTQFQIQYTLDRNIPSVMAYNWIVGTDQNNNAITPGPYFLYICPSGTTTGCTTSNGAFVISSTTAYPTAYPTIYPTYPTYPTTSYPSYPTYSYPSTPQPPYSYTYSQCPAGYTCTPNR